MKTLILGGLAGMALSVAVLVAPAGAAPIPTVTGAAATQSDSGVTEVRMMMRDKMMMRRKMMMRHKMMKHRMMKRRMMRRM